MSAFSDRELCVAVAIFKDIHDLLGRLCSNKVLDRASCDELLQWFTVELPAAGTEKIAVVKPSEDFLNFCAALFAVCGNEDAIQRAALAKSADRVGLGALEKPPGEFRIKLHEEWEGLLTQKVQLLSGEASKRRDAAQEEMEVPA